MFNFLDEIEGLTGLPFDLLKNGFKIYNYSNKCIYIENYKNILLISDSDVEIKMPKGMLKICGKNLKISKLNISSIMVKGEISFIKVEWAKYEWWFNFL